MEESLGLIQSKIDEKKVNLFNVNRRRLLDGAVRAIARKHFTKMGGSVYNLVTISGRVRGL